MARRALSSSAACAACPGGSRAQIRPPCASTICREIDKPKPGILAEPLLRPVGVEALEYALQRVRRDAGTVVLDLDDDLVSLRLAFSARLIAARRKATRTSPPGSENEHALSMRLVITCARRESWPMHEKSRRPLRRRAAPSTASASRRCCAANRRPSPTTARDARRGRRAGFAARELGVEPRGVGDVADQPVEAAHVMLHDRSSRSRDGPALTRGRVSTALRSEVSGFFSSCATSAAKLSIASMRL